MGCLHGHAMAAAQADATQQVHFNGGLLRGGPTVNISSFDRGTRILPGQYLSDLYVNQVWMGRADVNLRAAGNDPTDVRPCFDRALLDRIGVDAGRLASSADVLLQDPARCAVLPELVKDGVASFDPGEQRLDISLPQAAMRRSARGYVDPKLWDNGVTAARLAYNVNLYRNDSTVYSSTQTYVGLNAGFNIGAWRLQHIGSYSNSAQTGSHYQSVQTSLQRAILPLKSQLLIGDAFTDGTMFDSVGFRGVQMSTDDRMIPESQRGYAPVVHGIAYSNARVQIRQNGSILYETTVAPGAFEINDLYPTGYGGDLDVIITEADGSVRVSRVPYAATVNALREGTTYYSFTAGQYRNYTGDSKPWLVQATYKHGINNLLTGYSGLTAAEGYTSVVAGAAFNTTWGAIGADLTEAITRLRDGSSQQGQSLRLSYSKLVPVINTNILVAAYRYSSAGYYSLQDAMALRDPLAASPAALNPAGPNSANPFASSATANVSAYPLFAGLRTRGRLQLTVNQALPEGYGNFYFTGSAQSYWGRASHDTQFQFGYNNVYKMVSYGVSASREFNVTDGRWDNRFMVSVSIPLGSAIHAPYLTTSVQKDSIGSATIQSTMTGTLGENNTFNYSMSAAHSEGGPASSNNNFAASANYVTSIASVGANTSKGTGYTQAGLSASGGLVAYSGGVAFTPTPGDTEAIVEAADAAGARVVNGIGLRVDPWGHAVVSGLTPFARNQVEIDPKGLPLGVELNSTVLETAPTSGAVVRIKFETENGGRAAVLRLTLPDGSPLPFGAVVSNETGVILGTVAQSGRVLLRGLAAHNSTLFAKWGVDGNQSCVASYALPDSSARARGTLVVTDAVCRVNPASAATSQATSQGNSPR